MSNALRVQFAHKVEQRCCGDNAILSGPLVLSFGNIPVERCPIGRQRSQLEVLRQYFLLIVPDGQQYAPVLSQPAAGVSETSNRPHLPIGNESPLVGAVQAGR
jgi:hypothetical protein